MIVMLTNLEEKDTVGKPRPKCTRYWPEKKDTLQLTKDFKVKNEGEDDSGSWIVRNLNVTQAGH